MQELCQNLKIRQNISTAYHLQMDGQSERTNQWLEQYLRIFRNGAQTDWAKWLPLAQYTHNAWPSTAMGKAPFKLIMGHIPYTHIGKTHSLAPAINSRLTQTKAMRQAVQQAIMHMQQLTIRATKYKPFEEKQKVWLKATNLKTTHPTAKLSPKRYGPFKITKNCHTWSISCAFRSSGRSTTSSTHHSSPHIRRWRSTDPTTMNHPQTS